MRRSLTASLEESGAVEVVAEVGDGIEAVAETLHTAPEIVFVSLVLPEMSGTRTIGLISDVMPGISVVALAVEEEPEERFDALRAGACGVLDKEEVLASAVPAIARLLRGVPFVDADVAAVLLRRFHDVNERERSILERLAAGEDLAASSEPSSRETRIHLVNVLRRLHGEASLDTEADTRQLMQSLATLGG